MAGGGNPPMTVNNTFDISGSNLEPFAAQAPSSSRPSMISHQSNSLPSTPYIPPRELSDDCRTPSPTVKRSEMTSPRSARSESDTGTRPSARAPFLAGCRYETGMAHSRRRVPYSIGGDRLERASSTPKKTLDPKEEDKLCGDMRELYDRILPSRESEERRGRFVKKLEKILRGQWPGSDIKVHVFGSSGNLLCTTDSDVDICITTSMRALERVCLLAKALAEHGMERVVCVPHAKVPIVKIWDPELELACDMNVNNTLALENTRMIKTYVQIDERVRPLAMIIKHWTRQRILNDAALGGTLSSYTWICMIINFLQTRQPPILPCLHQRPHQRLYDAEGKLSTFADDIESLRGFGNPNSESIGALLFQFFRRYAHEIDFDKHVISIREGGLISKQAKKWHLMQNNRLCVEEPFNTERNLGNTVDDISFRGVHLELRRAFDLLCQTKLSECCEEYIFPPIEEKIWSKPPPQPRPILTRSLSQSGRSGRSTTSSRGQSNQKHRSGAANRRASSAAASNNIASKYGQMPMGAMPSNAAGGQIHEQLVQQWNLLQLQEQQLRMQMHQRQQANIRAHMTAQTQAPPKRAQGHNYPHHLNLDLLARHGNIYGGPLSAPLRNNDAVNYASPSGGPISIASFPIQPTIHTNPSSPSMVPAQLATPETRRSLHRSSTTDNGFATLRSHSQPASDMRTPSRTSRSLPVSHLTPNLPGGLFSFSSFEQYQQAYMQGYQQPEMQTVHTIAALSPRLNSIRSDPRSDDVRHHRQEYAGYIIEPSQPSYSHDYAGLGPQISAYRDFAQFSRGISPKVTRLRSHTSRSPSPSSFASHERTISFYSAPSAPSSTSGRRESAVGTNNRHAGPVIVDGSSDSSTEYLTAMEHQSRTQSIVDSEAASLPGESLTYTPGTAPATVPNPEPFETFDLDASPEPSHRLSVTNIPQFGDFPVRSHRRSIPATVTGRPSTDSEPFADVLSHDQLTGRMSNGLGIELGDNSSVASTASNGNVSPPKNISHSKIPSKIEISGQETTSDWITTLKPLPLLSPVREVRTPSPTAKRTSTSESYYKILHSRSISAVSNSDITSSPLTPVPNGRENAFSSEDYGPRTNGINGGHHGTVAGPSTEPRISPVESKASSSAWQQTGKKGKKSKHKGGSSISNLSEVADGERKGG